MAWTTPGTATAGEVLTAAFWNTQVRDNLMVLNGVGSAWTSWSPTITAGDWAVGNGTFSAKYIRLGTLIHFWMLFTLGSTTTKGTDLYMSLPVNAADRNSLNIDLQLMDVGTMTFRGFVSVEDSSTGSMRLMANRSDGTYVNAAAISSTVPFTWVTGDKIYMRGTYECAPAT